MPAPNYRFEKRQRDLAKKKKKDEKLLKKQKRNPAAPSTDGSPESPAETPTT